jgi:fermentation-respiration switch protein FrsA (DUF1100 family)
MPPVPQGVDIFPGLRGTPYVARMIDYRPIDSAAELKAATLIVDVGLEELFRIEDHGKKLYDLIKDRIPSKYHLFEDATHYMIYSRYRQEGLNLAIEWFKEHLGTK